MQALITPLSTVRIVVHTLADLFHKSHVAPTNEEAECLRSSRITAIVLPLLFLAVPSCWLMATVPPLWRDADAYVQLTFPPNPGTILLHGPLYCRLARVPLWIGDSVTGSSLRFSRFSQFIKHPHVTDAGVYLLLFIQHTGLCLAAFYLLTGLSESLLPRIVLAIFFASQPMFYGYAHCVGSETLSMIEILLLVGIGVRMVATYPTVKGHWWLLAGVLLFCCILTRHINQVLVGLFPLTFLLLALGQSWHFSWKQRTTAGVSQFRIGQHAGVFLKAIVVGIIALLLASGYVHLLCRKAHIRSQSKVGFTSVWRLNFLSAVPQAARHDLIERIARRTSLPDSAKFLGLVQGWLDHHDTLDPVEFLRTVRTGWGVTNSLTSREQFDRVLNDVAGAFLFPPISPLVAAARNDFFQATRLTEGDIARYLFATTDYINTHRAQMPQANALITFRRPVDQVMKFQAAGYFRLWDFLSIRGWCVVWLGVVMSACVAGKRAPQSTAKAVPYAVALCAVGMLMMILNCFFAQIQPRFASR